MGMSDGVEKGCGCFRPQAEPGLGSMNIKLPIKFLTQEQIVEKYSILFNLYIFLWILYEWVSSYYGVSQTNSQKY